MASPDCLDDDAVAELVEGRLGGDRLARAESHISSCAECTALVAAAAAANAVPTMTGAPASTTVHATLGAGARVGRYVVIEPLGEGGMGAVYAARDPQLDRKVALKLVRPSRGGPDLESRLLREAKAMARLSHPEVITVFDAGTHGDQLFIAMELVEGGTLREWLRDKPRTWRQILAIYLRAGRGLAQAHAAGIVHRDFKPDNVLVGDDGRVRVTDFGLARAFEDEDDDAEPASAPSDAGIALESTLTRTGVLVGTPAYMAPEQLGGKAADARSDIFGFCVALYEALYGERPFAGQTLKELHRAKVAGEVRPAPSKTRVPQRVRRALLVGLRAKPAERYATMEDLLVALDRAARIPKAPIVAGVAIVAAAFAIVPMTRHRDAPIASAASASASAGPTRECTSHSACVRSHDGAPYVCRTDGTCAPLASDDCTPTFEPADLLADDTVWLGAMFPTKGPAAEAFGKMNVDGTELARREIAQATSALEGRGASQRVRRIGLVTCDDGADAMRAARHLVDDVGVPAILGFGSGQKVVDVAGSLLIQRGVVAVASLTSSPLVTRLPQPPDLPRMVWRTTFSLDAVAEATARAIHDVLEPRARSARTRVTLARLDMAAGLSFAEAFYRRLEFNGKRAQDNGDDYAELPLPSSLAGADLGRFADRIVATKPTFVVLLGDSDTTVALVEAVEKRWPGAAPRPTYVIANDSTELFAPWLGKNVDRRRRLYAIESLSSSTANARFVIRYNAAHAAHVTATINPGVSYDAFYLLAYATFAIGDGAVTGVALARAFERLVPPGRSVEVGPTNVFDALTTLAGGAHIDLVGTQSALDFDVATGEAASDFALLCANIDSDGRASGTDVESGVVFRAGAVKADGALRCP